MPFNGGSEALQFEAYLIRLIQGHLRKDGMTYNFS